MLRIVCRSDRPELKALVEEVDGKLKKVVILYQCAFVKRRIRDVQTCHGRE